MLHGKKYKKVKISKSRYKPEDDCFSDEFLDASIHKKVKQMDILGSASNRDKHLNLQNTYRSESHQANCLQGDLGAAFQQLKSQQEDQDGKQLPLLDEVESIPLRKDKEGLVHLEDSKVLLN